MIFGNSQSREERELGQALTRGTDHVSNDILNEVGQKARKEIETAMRAAGKAKAFDRKKKRRGKKHRRR